MTATRFDSWCASSATGSAICTRARVGAAEHGLGALLSTLRHRAEHAPVGSYTRRLLDDPGLLQSKLIEEARELAAASRKEHVVQEAADVLFFAAVAMVRAGVRLEDVESELDRRALRVTRRAGDAKARAGG